MAWVFTWAERGIHPALACSVNGLVGLVQGQKVYLVALLAAIVFGQAHEVAVVEEAGGSLFEGVGFLEVPISQIFFLCFKCCNK